MSARNTDWEFDISKLTVTGISHHRTDFNERSLFTLDQNAQEEIYVRSERFMRGYCMILSTCNRTEIYADQRDLMEIMHVLGELFGSDFHERAYSYSGGQCIRHLFSVVSGVDSQIPGDQQIVGQVKRAFELSKASGCSHGLFEKIVNVGLLCSKRVRNETGISAGISSVPSALAQIVRDNFGGRKSKITILGTGSIGSLSCKNLLNYIEPEQICLVNRNNELSRALASDLGTSYMPYELRREAISTSDCLVVATGSHRPVVNINDIADSNLKLVVDLASPSNVDQEVKKVVEVVDLDGLAELASLHIADRTLKLDHAHQVIQREASAFEDWWQRRLERLSMIEVALPYAC